MSTPNGKKLFSRTGDDISPSFPEVVAACDFHAVLDGELMVKNAGTELDTQIYR